METPRNRLPKTSLPKTKLTRKDLERRIVEAGVLYNDFPTTELEYKVYQENWAAVRITVSYGGTYVVDIP